MGAKEFLFTAGAIAIGVILAGVIQTYVMPKLGASSG